MSIKDSIIRYVVKNMSLFNYTKKIIKYGEERTEPNVPKIIFHGFIAIILLIVGAIIVFGCWTVVDEGERGVVLKLGRVSKVMQPGFNMKNPITEDVVMMEVRIQKVEVFDVTAASQDLQDVKAGIAVQFNLEPSKVGVIYGEVGEQYKERIIDPAIQDIVKSVTAEFTAEELITKRPQVKSEVTKRMKTRLDSSHIIISNVDIVNFEFSQQFSAAIEDKQVQEQKALAQANVTRQEEEKKKQAILRAEAESERTRLEAQALLQNVELIEKINAEARLEAAKRWNGQLPTHLYGSAPLPLLDVTR